MLLIYELQEQIKQQKLSREEAITFLDEHYKQELPLYRLKFRTLVQETLKARGCDTTVTLCGSDNAIQLISNEILLGETSCEHYTVSNSIEVCGTNSGAFMMSEVSKALTAQWHRECPETRGEKVLAGIFE